MNQPVVSMPAHKSKYQYLSSEHLSTLIQSIYRCSMENSFLTSFLKEICDSCQLRSASAVMLNLNDMNITNVWEWGNNQQETETEVTGDLYLEDPIIKKLTSSATGQFYASNLDTPNWRTTVDPRIIEWSNNTGINEAAGAMILLENSLALTLYFQRGIEHPVFEKNECLFWNQLISHLSESFSIHQQLSQKKQVALETPAILDSFPLPTLLISATLDISIFNNKAKHWLETSTLVSIVNEKLCLQNKSESNLLNLKTSQLINSSSDCIENDDEEIFQWITGSEKITFVLKPLQKTSDQGDIYRGALCFIHQASKSILPSIKALREIFSLSQREAQICQLLSSGVDTKGIAEHFNLSVHTVRDVLKKRIFIKCDCNSQNALIALLLTSPAIFM